MTTRLIFTVLAGFLVTLTTSAQAHLHVPAPSGLTARNYLLMDFHSGTVLTEKDADQRVDPASLAKIMTAYLVFSELHSGKLSLEEEVLVSERAWRTGMTGASRMYIDVNSRVRVEDLIRGMIVQSGNDACVALAERIAGTEDAFVDMMNATAASMGLVNTRFQNSHGLPAGQPQFTSARDIVTLARLLIKNFPMYYGYYSERSFTFNDITQHNRNLLLGRDSSVDGVKTGWTSAAGFNLVSSAQRDEMRLVAVVMGISAESARLGGLARAEQSQALFNWGFRQFETQRVHEPNLTMAEARIFNGKHKRLPVGILKPFYVTILRGKSDQLQIEIKLNDYIEAPVTAGQAVGEMHALVGNDIAGINPLVALADVPEGGLFRKAMDFIPRLLN
jgi:serine-type D-Ala-D-Ala carboxypeptidase (penicillin-binding protein 5/6)